VGLRILRGEDVDVSYLAKIDRVDQACYDPTLVSF